MRLFFLKTLLAVSLIVCTPAISVAGDYALSWVGAMGNGVELKIHGFFAEAVGDSNAGVHLVAGDATEWAECASRIDLGEIQRREDDGWVILEIGDLIESPPFQMFFVRGEDYLVHQSLEVQYPNRPGKPIQID